MVCQRFFIIPLIFPGLEDFGLVPVEALACGCPVIAFGEGGATEVVEEGATGVLFPEQTVPSLVKALESFESIRFRPEELYQSVQKFSRSRFRQSWQEFFRKVGLKDLSPWSGDAG